MVSGASRRSGTDMEFANTVTIERSAQDVFQFLADFQNIPKWNYGWEGGAGPHRDEWPPTVSTAIGRATDFLPRVERGVRDPNRTGLEYKGWRDWIRSRFQVDEGFLPI